MGYERKRGKLADLNQLLRDSAADRFSLVVGDTAVLSAVKYVITLDTDTQLPRDAARQFVGTMAHPLNRPRYDEEKQRVCDGYGILQPRVAVSLPGTNRSRYARLNGSDPGIDPYTRAISDVYQDLFGEGSFIGKGIYEVEAFERSLTGRFPENTILSHDLLEGCYARAGLLSDVHLYEEYPSCYSLDVSRRYRWIRGDWQLAGWLLPRVPGPDAQRLKNPLSGLSRWKLFDNLRRSLVPFALTLLLLLGWTVLSPIWLWTLSVIGIILVPPLLATILNMLQKPEDVLPEQHAAVAIRAAGRHVVQTVLTVTFLPYEAFYSVGAIVRTIWRMAVTHTRLLEWNPSSNQDLDRRTDLVAYSRMMWIGPVLAAAAAMYLSLEETASLDVAVPILGLWLASPVVAWWISQPITRPEVHLTTDQTIF
ncbi:MAG: glycosyltransferase family 2 protein, partial [Nitrospirota bacterium]